MHECLQVSDQRLVVRSVGTVLLIEPLHQRLDLRDDRHARFAVRVILLPHAMHQRDGVVGKGVGRLTLGRILGKLLLQQLPKRFLNGWIGFVAARSILYYVLS